MAGAARSKKTFKLSINSPWRQRRLRSSWRQRLLRDWRERRDLRALLKLLDHRTPPDDLVQVLARALKEYLKEKTRHDDLARYLIGAGKTGRGSNPKSNVSHANLVDRAYAAVLGAELAGWRGKERWVQAERYLEEEYGVKTDWKTIRGQYYKRKNHGPISNLVNFLALVASSLMQEGPHYVEPKFGRGKTGGLYPVELPSLMWDRRRKAIRVQILEYPKPSGV